MTRVSLKDRVWMCFIFYFCRLRRRRRDNVIFRFLFHRQPRCLRRRPDRLGFYDDYTITRIAGKPELSRTIHRKSPRVESHKWCILQ